MASVCAAMFRPLTIATVWPADTLVGVEALSRSDYLIEVDAIAVIDG